MNDLISRKAAIDVFDSVKVDEEDCTEYDIGYNDGIDFAVSRLSVLPSAQPVARDIDVLSKDLISRQAVIDQLHQSYNLLDAERRLEDMPSAQTEKAQLSGEDTTSDCINRKAAIDALGERPAVWIDDDEYSLGQRNQYDCDKLAIETVPSVTPKHHWIPCSERLPYAEYGESSIVLATCGYRNVEDGSIRWIRMLYYDGGNWCYLTGETYLGKVYAWMPLPESYREEGETDG